MILRNESAANSAIKKAKRKADAEQAKRKAEAAIVRVLGTMEVEKLDALVTEDNAEYQSLAASIMSWWTLLFASNILRKGPKVQEVLAGSLVVLGTLVKYAYGLGIRRGIRMASTKTKRTEA